MKILVTGGAGYIGSSLVAELDNRSEVEQIIVFDNLSQNKLDFFLGPDKLHKVKFVQADILDSYTLEQIIPDIDVIYHLAAFVSFPYNHKQNLQYDQINKWGTLNLVRCVKRTPNHLIKIIYLSSLAVYGLRQDITYADRPSPSNAYGESKLAAEKYIELLKGEVPYRIVRAANVFGYNKAIRTDSVINHFIFNGLVNGKILIYGNGEQYRAHINLENLIAVLIDALNSNSENPISNYSDFNANLNQIKEWLLRKIPNLEYTYVNQNIAYEMQSVKNLKRLTADTALLDKTFDVFKNHIRITSN